MPNKNRVTWLRLERNGKHLDMALLLRTFKVSFTNLECKPNYVVFVLIFFVTNSNVVKNNLCRMNALID